MIVKMFCRITLLSLSICCALDANAARAEEPAVQTEALKLLPGMFIPSPIEGAKQEIKLPASTPGFVVGGGGRYLVMRFETLSKLAVFDLCTAKIAYYVTLEDAETMFAASLEKLVLVSPSKMTIARYNLATGVREKVQPLPAKKQPIEMALGSASAGPLLLIVKSDSQPMICLDLETLKESAITAGYFHVSRDYPMEIRAAANGRIFAGWEPGISPSGVNLFTVRNNSIHLYNEHTSVGTIIPSPTGKMLYTDRGIRQLNEDEREERNREQKDEGSVYHPATHGEMYYCMTTKEERNGRGHAESNSSRFTVHLPNQKQPLYGLTELEIFSKNGGVPHNALDYLDSYVAFVPGAKVLAVLSPTRDRLTLYRINVDQALAKTAADYFFVDSVTPLSAVAGVPWEYPLQVRSKADGVKYRLEIAPAGMTISAAGVISWTPPATGGVAQVAVAITNAKQQELFYSFDLTIQDRDGNRISNREIESAARSAPAVTPAEPLKQPVVIKYPAVIEDYAVGGNGRYLVLHFPSLKRIGVFGLENRRFLYYLPVDDGRVLIAAGLEKLFVGLNGKRTLSRYDLKTGERELTTPLGREPLQDLAIGSAALGPLYLLEGERDGAFLMLEAVDVRQLKKTGVAEQVDTFNNREATISIAPNNSLILTRGVAYIPVGNKLVRHHHQGERELSPTTISADGKVLYGRIDTYTAEMKSRNTEQIDRYTAKLPALDGPFYLCLEFEDLMNRNMEKFGLYLHLQGETKPLVKLTDKLLGLAALGEDRPSPLNHRALLFTASKRLVYLGAESLVIVPFDTVKLLASSNLDYLFVDSQPPSSAKVGEKFEYQIAVKSSKGGLQFKLDNGPPGMVIDALGKLTWNIPANHSAANNAVIVTIKDAAGQEFFYTFTIALAELQPKPEPSVAENNAKAEPVDDSEQADRKEFRVWKDSAGKLSVEARFVEVYEDKVTLRLKGGQLLEVPLDTLTPEDRKIISSWVPDEESAVM